MVLYTEHILRQIKLYVMGYASSNDYWGSQIPRLINHGIHKRLTVRSIKLFADGALGSWGGALIAPTMTSRTRGDSSVSLPRHCIS
jgi:hypothetical protein